MTYQAPDTSDTAPLAQQIEDLIDGLPGDHIRVGTLLHALRDRPLWVPQRLADKQIATDKLKANLGRALKWVHRMERLSRPMRLAAMVRSKKMMRLNNLALVFATILLMLPAGPIPFSNTLPALALMSFAIGFIQRDGAAVAAGYGFVVASVVYFGVLLGGVGFAAESVFSGFRSGSSAL
jgi:hypothetical protein